MKNLLSILVFVIAVSVNALTKQEVEALANSALFEQTLF
jgi:hypothetical protein